MINSSLGIRNLVFGFCAIGLLICGLNSRAEEESKPVVRAPLVKIALVQVLDPPRLTVQNRGSAWNMLAFPGYIIQKNSENGKSDSLTLALRSQGLNLGNEMTLALRDQLTQMGYTVEIITDAKRQLDDPDSVDYKSVHTSADAILSAHYQTVGLYSGQFSTDYAPRIEFDIEVVTVDTQDELYSQSIDYGGGIIKSEDDEIPADGKYAYGSFDDAMARQAEVVEGLRAGIGKIANLAAQQLKRGN